MCVYDRKWQHYYRLSTIKMAGATSHHMQRMYRKTDPEKMAAADETKRLLKSISIFKNCNVILQRWKLISKFFSLLFVYIWCTMVCFLSLFVHAYTFHTFPSSYSNIEVFSKIFMRILKKHMKKDKIQNS